ncbi:MULTISPECIES: septation protein SepH [unclassified Micromonospora]|uniref:septation protein SepH n=1 Tax=unclassified Micromonospora TaxID=2617518 RepID=UPI0022B6F04C|nr:MULTISPECIES: septation protein SepH [unclassified Micromonospora]MCZ7421310.1 septation protein SepH [Verrucosispora sp. WMMA2121]WBB47909.1 septation protein SepH [Verrucosispora sp. WMMA2044]WBB93995.1 septation protein SepH [Verrucosispora sp. WMMC514]
MRPVRFVALSEDGQALVLADEVGRLLALPLDERIAGALHAEPGTPTLAVAPAAADPVPSLSPRDIQARIRSGESAEDVARIAGVPVDRVLRYAGPVLQERAMLAQHARRTRLKGAEKPTPLAEVVNGRLAQHGIDTEKISWDAWRRDDGTWRIVATWPSGKATAQAVWDLDKTRQSVAPHDDMAQYLCAERPTPILGQEPAPERGGHALPGPSRGEPSRGGHGLPSPAESGRAGRDPIRAGRDALLASLDRPLGSTTGRGLEPRTPAALAGGPDTQRQRAVGGGAAALLGGGQGSAFDDDADAPKEVPAVPSLAVLRPRRTNAPAAGATESGEAGGKPRKRLPSWDDVLFGTGPAARESS